MLKGSDINGINKHHYTFIWYKSNIRGLGEELDESLVVQKVLRSLLLNYDAKVSAIEETRDLTKMKMDKLHMGLL